MVVIKHPEFSKKGQLPELVARFFNGGMLVLFEFFQKSLR